MRPVLFYSIDFSKVGQAKACNSEVFMRLLLLLLLSITNIYAQEKVLGVDIPKDFLVEYNEWDNIYNIYSSNIKVYREELQKEVLKDSYLIGAIAVVEDTNLSLSIYNDFWEDSEYQHKSKEYINAMFYIKNNDKILKKEMLVYSIGKNGSSTLAIADHPLIDGFDLSFIIDNLNENSTLRIKDFADNVFEYEGEDLKPLVDTIKLYKQLKQK